METRAEIMAKLPAADELVRRAINSVRKEKPFPKSRALEPGPLWARVMSLFQQGSTYSAMTCIKYGFDPDETWKL